MRVGKNDWAFKVNSKNGNLEMQIPHKESYSPAEFDVVAVGLMRFCAPIGMLFDHMLKQAAKADEKKAKGSEKK